DRIFTSRESPDLWPHIRRVLLESGSLTPHEINLLEREGNLPPVQESGDKPAGRVFAEEDYAEALGLALHLPRLRLDRYRIVPAFTGLIPKSLAERWQTVILFAIGGEVLIASPTVPPGGVLEAIRSLTGFEPRLGICTPSEARRALERAYGLERGDVRGRETHSARKPLWTQLLEDGDVDNDKLSRAQAIALQTGEAVERILLRLGHVQEQELLRASARLHGTQVVKLDNQPVDRSLLVAIPEPIARRHRCLPLRRLRESVVVAMVDAGDDVTAELLEILLGQPVQPVLCAEADLLEAFRGLYSLPQTRRDPEWALLGQYLVRSGRLTNEQLEDGLRVQQKKGKRLGQCLQGLGLLDETDLAETLGLQLRLPSITISRYSMPAETLNLVPEQVARLYAILPLYQEDRLLTVATAEPYNSMALQEIWQSTGLVPRVVLAGEQSIRTAIDRLYSMDTSKISGELRGFGDKLVRLGLLSQEQLLDALRLHLKADVPFDVAAMSLGFLSERQFGSALAEYFDLPQADLSYQRVPVPVVDGLGIEREILRWTEPVDSSLARLLPEEAARRFSAIPFKRLGSSVAVAFVNPLEAATRRSVQELIGQPISVMIGTRSQIEEAIRRVHHRRVLGDILLEADLISRRQLEAGLDLHRKTGVPLGKALVSLGHITQDQLAASLSNQQGLAYSSLLDVEIPDEVARSVPEPLARKYGLIPLAREDGHVTVAMTNPLNAEAVAEVEKITGCRVKPVLTTERHIEDTLERIYRSDYLTQSASDLVIRYPDDSAIKVLSGPQKLFLLAFLGVSALLAYVNPVGYIVGLTTLSTLFYVTFSGYKFYLIYKALSHSLEVDVTPEEIAALDSRELPVYSVLVPLYREAEVLPNLIRAIDHIDYPKTKLDVKLLLEEDDEETIAAVRRHKLPPHFKPVIVPHSRPKGKPKACNYGLIHAEGEFAVIYDAEDIPERDQLKKALVAFRKAAPNVGCIQAKLNYYNRDQNMLTRWFTTEYSMWFDLFMPALDASNAPVPLGGTSNHFPTSLLRQIGAWDPYNVTEDADLGMRMFKAGWKTAIIDSTTYEEANSELYNWIRQRSRWVKGYIQTYLVHMRHPIKLLREIGPYQFFSFNMVVGGTFFGFLMNPIYWLLTAAWFLTHWSVIQQLFPGPIFYVGALGLYFGNFAFTYANVAGCMRRQYYDMVKYALLSPVYWSLMSVGAWKGLVQLLYRPSYWEKTLHGLYRADAIAEPQADRTPGTL
ncbi:MAG: glycosyltransferase, partial [Chloroflexi bacterium]|nr:glycosyltransferase [Chloroflexota bacterium]